MRLEVCSFRASLFAVAGWKKTAWRFQDAGALEATMLEALRSEFSRRGPTLSAPGVYGLVVQV